jgi:hypothetical protein
MTDDGYKPKLTRNEYLQAYALFTMANTLSRKAYEFEWAMNRIVRPGGREFGGGHLGDAIYATEAATAEIFDEALKRTGIEVEESTP